MDAREPYNYGHPANRPRNILRRLNRAAHFPINTCPSSRHAAMIGEALIYGRPYAMLHEEPEHCGGSILSVVESLWKARTEIDELRAKLGMPSRTEEAMRKPIPIFPSPDTPSPSG